MNKQLNYYLANGAVLFVLALGFVGLIKSLLTEDVTPPCNERYSNYVVFPENVGTGERVSFENIEHHLDGDVQGLSAFTTIVSLNAGGPAVQFETRLPKGSSNPRLEDGIIGGMGFAWTPQLSVKATSACLTYKVWLPKNFKFAKGGKLPGLFGGAAPGDEGYPDPSVGFSESIVWRKDGRPTLRTYGPIKSSQGGIRTTLGKHALPLGRWVKLSQEVTLNSPGQSDGISRVWIDGELKHEAIDVMFRKNENLNFSGVLADAYYDSRRHGVSPKDTFLRLTPFILNWK